MKFIDEETQCRKFCTIVDVLPAIFEINLHQMRVSIKEMGHTKASVQRQAKPVTHDPLEGEDKNRGSTLQRKERL